MMFLVIFGSLGAAMAIVSQGSLATADAQLKINRSLATAETGMHFIKHRMRRVAAEVRTDQGVITTDVAETLWSEAAQKLYEEFSGEWHNLEEPVLDGDALHLGPIEVAPDTPAFSATLRPHPLPDEDYDSAAYQRPPYSEMSPPVSSEAALDARWIRVHVTATDSRGGDPVSRSVSMDFEMTKRVPYAILSRNRVMLGRNVVVHGPIGSSFTDTDLEHGHPIQMLSDFRGLNDELDEDLDALLGTLIENDTDADNRINIADPNETEGITDPEEWDYTGDGYIDEFDLFLRHFDVNGDGRVTLQEMKSNSNDPARAEELFHLIDRAGYGEGDPPPNWLGNPEAFPGRPGWGDGVIDERDRYAKVHGSVYIDADKEGWNDGAAGGAYQDHFKGPIRPEHNEPAVDFDAEHNDAYEFGPEDFDVQRFRDMATGDLMAQAQAQAANHDPEDPNSPQPLGQVVTEEVPYGSAFPYEFYDRPVFENMTFNNVLIPKGTNALFRNCTFIGVTFIETETNNTDPDFNYAGMRESDGTPKFPDRVAMVNGQEVADTRTVSNNVRFEDCTFEGPVISDVPQEFTHVRNKLEFNGATEFNIEDSQNLSTGEKELFQRSMLLAPHYSVEIGSFSVPDDPDQRIDLSGTLVAGVLDMRGNVRVDGTLLTTFHPVPGEGPVVGDTSPLFNTTLGYFGPEHGDFEAELPGVGLGSIELRYDPTLAPPDGISGPIRFEPLRGTYTEGG